MNLSLSTRPVQRLNKQMVLFHCMRRRMAPSTVIYVPDREVRSVLD